MPSPPTRSLGCRSPPGAAAAGWRCADPRRSCATCWRFMGLADVLPEALTNPAGAGGRTAGSRRSVLQEERQLAEPIALELEHLDRPRVVAARRSRSACTDRTPAVPFAPPAGRTRELLQPIPGPTHQAKMSSRPCEPHVVRRHRLGRVLADQRGQRLHVVALEGLDVAAQQVALSASIQRRHRVAVGHAARHRAWRGHAGARCSPTRRSCRAARRPRAACQRSTSHRISTARWRGGRCWSAATNASRIVSRGDGHARPGRSPAARARRGSAAIHVASGSDVEVRARRARAAGPRSIGRARRSRPLSMSRQTFVAIR